VIRPAATIPRRAASGAVTIHRKNGCRFLDATRHYLNDIRTLPQWCTPLVTDLLPASSSPRDGETVDFRRAPPTWKNPRLVKAG
jgi:hypothetical protein